MVLATVSSQLLAALGAAAAAVETMLSLNYLLVSGALALLGHVLCSGGALAAGAWRAVRQLCLDLTGFVDDALLLAGQLSADASRLGGSAILAVSSCCLQLTHAVARAVALLGDVTALCWRCVELTVLTTLDCVLGVASGGGALYRQVTTLLAAVPGALAAGCWRVLELLAERVLTAGLAVLQLCRAVAEAVVAALLCVYDSVAATPPAAVAGAALLLLACWALRRVCSRSGGLLAGLLLLALFRLLLQLLLALGDTLLALLSRCRPPGWLRFGAGCLSGSGGGEKPQVCEPAGASGGVNSSPRGARSERLCVVCCEAEREVVLLPCRHLCLCGACSDLLLRQSRQCPLCRGRVHQYISVFV